MIFNFDPIVTSTFFTGDIDISLVNTNNFDVIVNVYNDDNVISPLLDLAYTVIRKYKMMSYHLTPNSNLILKGTNDFHHCSVSKPLRNYKSGPTIISKLDKSVNTQVLIDSLSNTDEGDKIILPSSNNPTFINAFIQHNNEPAQKKVMVVTHASYPYEIENDRKEHVVIGTSISDDNGQVFIDCHKFNEKVMVLCWDDFGIDWMPNISYEIGDIIHPKEIDFLKLKCVYKCITPGNSGSEYPVFWEYNVGATGYIGTALFIAIPYIQSQTQGPFVPTSEKKLDNGDLVVNGVNYKFVGDEIINNVHCFKYLDNNEDVIYRQSDTGNPFIPFG